MNDAGRPRGASGLKRIWLTIVWFVCLGCNGSDRAKEIEVVGRPLGFVFAKEIPPTLAVAIRAMPSIQLQDKNFFSNVLISDDVLVFDWTWRTKEVKDRTLVRQTVVAVHVPAAGLPEFAWTVRGELGRKDLRRLDSTVDFEGAPSFSDRFEVAGRDRARIREVFPAERRETLELPSGLRVEGIGEWTIGYRPGLELAPEDVPAAIQEMRSFTLVTQ